MLPYPITYNLVSRGQYSQLQHHPSWKAKLPTGQVAHMNNIRNFSIIAHIDHGKSTLADRFLEVTGTIEKRKMRDQVLDSMELERERGITIKMQPVRMRWRASHGSGPEHVLNLIDTPGHIDFSYEVSRAQKAVEGAILLVDATQGVQAQTLSVLSMAREQGLTIIPAISKIDSPLAEVARVKEEVARTLAISPDSILLCSGKTGEGVPELLDAVVARIPPPQIVDDAFRALVFDFQYSDHKGVILFVRVMGGRVTRATRLELAAAGSTFGALEVGTFSPDPTAAAELPAGSIGYIVTGIKEPGVASVGDTVREEKSRTTALPGYQQPKPVVWASIYPESQDDFLLLKQSLARLRLSDSSLSYEEETSGTLGRGYRCGFLGMLHLEIITERLRREFKLSLIVTTPTITYRVELKNGKQLMVYSPPLFPEYGQVVRVFEPWVRMKIITPERYLGDMMRLFYDHEAEVGESENFGDTPSQVGGRIAVHLKMPLRELMRNFFDKVKTVSSGYASVSYEIAEEREADVARLDVLVADELVAAFSRVVSKRRVEEEAEAAVERLHKILPRQLFTTKIQAQALGRIISSRTMSALRKDVTGYLYGGDRTRKMKLLEKQKKGKKKMKERGRVNIPHEVFLKMVKSE